MFGFEWLAKPVVKYLGIGIASLVLLAAAYLQGRGDGVAITEAKYLQATVEWQTRVYQAQLTAQQEISEILFNYKQVQNGYAFEIEKLMDKLTKKPKVLYIKKYIPAEIDTLLPKGFIELYNTTIAGKPLNDEPNATYVETSNFTLSHASGIIGANNYRCNQTKQQLKALQRTVSQFQYQQRLLSNQQKRSSIK